MTAVAAPAPALSDWGRWKVLGSLVPRWLTLLVAAAGAFHGALGSVAGDIAQGSALSYLLAVPLYAVFAAVAVLRRAEPSLNIHDRETDVIVGGVGVALPLAATALLGPQLAAVYYLWRVDLLMLVLFTLGGSILLFGLRPTLRFRLAWAVALMLWPLPVRVLIFTIGGGSVFVSAVFQLLVILALIRYGRRRSEGRQQTVTLLVSAVLGTAVLLSLQLDVHPEWQMFPALAALVAALVSWGFLRRAGPVELGDPVVMRPLAALVVLAVASCLGVLTIPDPPAVSPVSVPATLTAQGWPGPVAPPGWNLLSATDLSGAPSQYFGVGARWDRYRLQATGSAAGPGAVDAQGRHRDVVVDVTTSSRPRSFTLYPVVTTYPMGTLELSPAREVDLGNGVDAQLYAAVDSRRQLTWTLLTFTWRLPAQLAVAQPDRSGPAQLTQRVTVMAVDDHRAGAPFPEPGNALLDSVKAALAGVVRGSTTAASAAVPKDVDLLSQVGRQIVTSRTARA